MIWHTECSAACCLCPTGSWRAGMPYSDVLRGFIN